MRQPISDNALILGIVIAVFVGVAMLFGVWIGLK